jgi:hypothetical protein
MSTFNSIWPYAVVASGILVALTFAFDMGGVATRVAGRSGGRIGGFWSRMPAPCSHVNRPNYWRIVGFEIGGVIVLFGVICAMVVQHV